MSLPEVYKDSIELFEKTFDVPKLCFDILSRVKEPATCGKLYKVEVINVVNELFKLKVEFKTDENTYFDVVYNLENSLSKAEDFCGSLGCTINSLDSIKGRRYKVFYANIFETIVLGVDN